MSKQCWWCVGLRGGDAFTKELFARLTTIESAREKQRQQLASQVPQGVHASMSGIPWWTTDVGGYGCGFSQPNESPYMKELIVRWYQVRKRVFGPLVNNIK